MFHAGCDHQMSSEVYSSAYSIEHSDFTILLDIIQLYLYNYIYYTITIILIQLYIYIYIFYKLLT